MAKNTNAVEPVVDLEAEVLQISGELSALEAEQISIIEEYAAAVDRNDGAAMVALRKRSDELPLLIRVAKLRKVTSRIAKRESEIPKKHADVEAAALVVNAAKEKHDKALDALRLAQMEVSVAQNEVSFASRDLGQLKRERDELMNQELRQQAPIVRSVPHMVVRQGAA